ncbi:MAG: hypothetical protein HUK25_00700 [Treponema sp.]|nr:hypothetical protein [Treponema sp.]
MQLGWIDFSESDRKKVLEVIQLLSTKGAVDELGFGIIRDGFADYFFPGTSTVQTRAKYFVLVPYILKEAASEQNPTKFLDNTEKNIATELYKKGERNGLIGSDSIAAGKWVIRPPSDIYWNGIKKMGIFRGDISINQYFQEVSKIKKIQRNNSGNTSSQEEGEHDDWDAGRDTVINFWDIPTYKKNWRDNLSIELSNKEASFLKKKILSLKTKKGEQTLYSYILENRLELTEKDSFEDLYNKLKKQIGPEMAGMMDLANKFNYLAMIAKCRYNIILSDGNNLEAKKNWEIYQNRLEKIACVDVDKIFQELNLRNSALKSFLKQLQSLLLKNEIEKVDELIIFREKQLKGSDRAKLLHPERYNPEDLKNYFVGTLFLDYRMHSAIRILNDIYGAESV